jgi:sugar lactone lactonase YvrE
MVRVFDATHCALGEAVFWHQERNALFWIDILAGKLFSRDAQGLLIWQFPEMISAAAVVDKARLVISGETGLFLFDLETEAPTALVDFPQCPLPRRANDGRVDPWGGFWVSTIGHNAEPEAGAIYRYIDAKLVLLCDKISIPNAICFAPDRSFACFADTARRHIMKVALDAQGWPSGEARVHIDLTAEGLNPDGAVMDQSGCLWVAFWGASKVSRFGPDGRRLMDVAIPATNASCPAFGGEAMQRLFITSARVGLEAPTEMDGRSFYLDLDITGVAEPRIALDL